MFRTLELTLPPLVVAAILAGCGQGTLTASQLAATGTATSEMRGLGGGAPGQKGGGPGMKGRERGGPGGGMMAYQQVSDLTDEQKTQIEAIQAKYRPAAPTDDASAKPVNQVAELLKAETLDVAALEAALAAQPTRPERPDHAAMLAEIRAVLTDAQRAEIVAKIEARPEPQAPDAANVPTDRPSPPSVDERVAQVATKLGLNDAQKAALVAFETAMEANRPARDQAKPDFAAHVAAELAFWRTGDAAALTAAKPADVAPPAFPVDAFVALAQALTAEQRVQLLARGPMGGGHGGPGGPGGDFAKGGGFGEGGPRGGR